MDDPVGGPLSRAGGDALDRLVLRALREDDEATVRQAHEELRVDGFSFLLAAEGASWPEVLEQLRREREGVDLPADRVPCSFLLAELDGEVVGRASVRHELDDWLLRWGGHIGYAVRPAWRRRGIATEILRRSLTHLREVTGAERALLTCDDHNLASAATIERCGGVLEDVVSSHADGPPKRRYWVSTSS